MNRKFLLSLFVFLFLIMTGVLLHAQYSIKGLITDKGQQPVSYAIVTLVQKSDSAALQSTVPDAEGRYQLELSDVEDKMIKVTAIGYLDTLQKIKATSELSQVIDFVLLESKTNLDEVSISSGKLLFERKVGRVVFNVAASLTAAGGTALDALRKTPGVLVRQQDNTISVVGKGGVQVLVNDRLLQLAGEDLVAYLQAIPSANIDRIEVITTPPAKYDAAGNSGLINIVLKKNNNSGLNGNLRAGYEQANYAKGILGGDINYRHSGLNIYGNINYANGANNIVERLRTPYTQQDFNVTDDYKRILKPLAYTMGIDYELHPNGIIGLQWMSNYGNRINESQSGIEVRQRNTGLLDSTMMTNGYSTVRSDNNLLNLSYTWNIDTSGKKFSINANQLWFSGRRNNDFETVHYLDTYAIPTGMTSNNKSVGIQDINITAIQADLELPYTLAALSFGGKLSFIDNKSANHFGVITKGVYEENPSISNAFDYSEKVQAVYVNAQRTLGKWSFQAGLRGEFTQTSGYSLNLTRTSTNQYFNLFPTAFVQYQFSENHNWNLNYNKRINRPDYRSLDPFRAYATPYHYNEGNPFLLPSFNHNAELAYTFKSRYSLSAFYQYERNHFGSVWFTDAWQNVTSGLSMNFADVVNYGLNAMASFQPVAWWEVQVQSSIQQQRLKSKIYTATEQSYRQWMYYAGFNISFALNKGKTLLAEVDAYCLSKYRQDFLEINPNGCMNLGFRCLLLQKRLGINLSASDIFATQRYKGKHIVTGQTINNYFDTRNIRLSLNYKFGNNKLKEKGERNTGIEEEKGRTR